MKRQNLIFVFVLLVIGCTHYALVKPERQPIGNLYTVETEISWSKSSEGHIEVWTVDGPLLEALRFVNGIEDGETLLKVDSERSKLPRFRVHMTPSDVLEFFVASIKAMGGGFEAEQLALGRVTNTAIITAGINAGTIEATNLRPSRFGSLSGFRFDKEGLEREGMVLGTIHKEKLYLIVYAGARQYYYPMYREEVERLFSSIEIKSN
jgi:hypothetical protein